MNGRENGRISWRSLFAALGIGLVAAASGYGPAFAVAADEEAIQQGDNRKAFIRIRSDYGVAPVLKPGTTVTFDVLVPVAANARCYYQESSGVVMNLYPNQFTSVLREGRYAKIPIPGTDSFRITADRSPAIEQFICYGTSRNLAEIVGNFLAPSTLSAVKVGSLAELDRIITARARQDVAKDIFIVVFE